jgi:hypothetical protein
MVFFAVLVSFLLGVNAHAYLDTSVARGDSETLYQSPKNYVEKCVITRNLPFAETRRSPKKEEKLCSIDLHVDAKVGVCPKYGSTNPALDIYQLAEEANKLRFEADVCTNAAIEPDPTKIAKFKASVSCSYTPSIIGYYHLSQFLNGPVTPAAVLRTYDAEMHRAQREKAMNALSKVPSKRDALIAKTWNGEWGKAYNNPRSINGERVFTADLKGVYGALLENTRGETRYKEVYGGWRDYEKRFDSFTAQKPYQRIIDPRPLAQTVGKTFAEAAPILQQVHDVSTMLILDYLMAQTDRPGNIHYKEYYWAQNTDGSIKREKETFAGAVPVKEMVLTDNDCGLIKGNETKRRGLLNMLGHIHPQTYKSLQRLAQEFATNESAMTRFLKHEWLFSDSDIKNFRGDTVELARHLKSRCKAGSLHLDADVKEFLAGKTTQSCD